MTVTKEVAYKQGELHDQFKDALSERNDIERKLNVAYAKYMTASDKQKSDAYKQYRHYKKLSEQTSSRGGAVVVKQKMVHDEKPEHRPVVDAKEIILKKQDEETGEWKTTCTLHHQAVNEATLSQTRLVEGPVRQTVETIITQNTSVKVEEIKLQKWKMLSTTRDYSNGQIVISEKPPMDKCVFTHAFTAHSTIGETARRKVFIDWRNMFEIEHWETIVGRAKRWEDIVIVNLPDPDPADKYANTKMYCIASKKGNLCYIGFTTLPTVEERGKQHSDDYKSKKKKQCMSRLVLKFKDWQIELIEEFPCASRRQAEAREMYHINRAENCVNKNTATDKSLPTCAITKRKAVVADAQEQSIVVEEDPTIALRLEIEERLKMEAEAEDNAIAAQIAYKVQRKRKAEEAVDDRFDENGNLKSFSFQLPVKQQKAKPKMKFSWMKK